MSIASCRSVLLCAAVVACCFTAETVDAAEKPEIVAARLGLGNCYRAGRWAPLRIDAAGGDEPLGVQVLASTPDADGFGVGFTAADGRPLSTEPGRVTSQLIYVCPGSNTAVVEVNLLSGGKRVAKRVFSQGDPDEIETGGAFELGAAAAENVVLQLGGEAGATEAVVASETATWRTGNAAPIVNRVEDLPSSPLGYDAFDAIVLLAGARTAGSSDGWLGGLTPSDSRVVALRQWVEQGGRLVISCGSGGGGLIGPGGVLEAFLPGEYTGPEPLTVAAAIEQYAEAPDDVESIDVASGSLTISGLKNTQGVIEAYAGRSREESPLVVRRPFGFGEVTFVAFDLDAPAVSGWRGRSHLVRRLLRVDPPQEDEDYYGYWNREEVTDALLSKLENSFNGVKTAPFIAIVGLVVLYLLLIGPGDYLFVKNVVGRMEATWLTFPLIVAATSAAAYYGAYWLKGDDLKVNQIEIVDVDTIAGRARGLLVTDLFSPVADRYTTALAARTINNEPLAADFRSTTWIARQNASFGMGARSATGVRPDYQLAPDPRGGGRFATAPGVPSVFGLPIQVWSTKALVSRYTGEADRSIVARLTRDRDGLVDGSITNESGVALVDCHLLYGAWAWDLGRLAAGASMEIGDSSEIDSSDLVRVKTFLGSLDAGLRDDRAEPAVAASARLISIGSRRRQDGRVFNQMLARSDLGPHLEAGRALLLAQLDDGPRSELMRVRLKESDAKPLIPDEGASQHRRQWVFVNFILPVSDDGTE